MDVKHSETREERRLMVFENRIPRRIIGLMRDTNGDWRRLTMRRLHLV